MFNTIIPIPMTEPECKNSRLQIGLLNYSENSGVQFGLVNDTFKSKENGIRIGLLNFDEDGFMPFFNITRPADKADNQDSTFIVVE